MELSNLLSDHRPITVLAGAGLSAPPPTCLPGWWALNNAVLGSLGGYIEKFTNKPGLSDGFRNAIRQRRDSTPVLMPDLQAQLLEDRASYDKQMEEYKKEIEHAWDVVEMVYQTNKSFFRVNDFEDIAKKMKNKIKRRIKAVTGDPLYEDMKKTWNEIMYIKAGETDVEKLNQTYLYEKTLLKKMLRRSLEKIQQIYGFRNPKMRVIMEERVNFLIKEFDEFDYLINPYHIQPGLILDMDITSIKRKKFTLMGMANVLNEFLHGISKGFQDAAFASFKRRRSTLREDISQTFTVEEPTAEGPMSYSESLMSGGAAPKSSGVKGKADVTPRKKKSDLEGLKEL